MKRERKTLTACLDQQAAEYRGGDRNDDPELGAGTGFGSHLDAAMNGLDLGPNDIEADTSSGHISDERPRRQTGLEGQPKKLLLGHSVGVDAAAAGLVGDARHVDAP